MKTCDKYCNIKYGETDTLITWNQEYKILAGLPKLL